MQILSNILNELKIFIKEKFLVEDFSGLHFDYNLDLKREKFGDFSCNAPLFLAKKTKNNPISIGNIFLNEFKKKEIDKIELAGAGFINIYLSDNFYKNLILEIEKEKYSESFFINKLNEKNLNYNVEFVSANPTGPLHIGHGRGGIIGDTLVRILREKNIKVTSEFYVNDAGAQIQKLGNSLFIRYKQSLNISAELPEDAYHGEYLIDLAEDLKKNYGDSILNNDLSWFSEYGKKILLENLKETLSEYKINFDIWFSEKKLHESGSIEKVVSELIEKKYIYELDGALWFESTKFGDDKDRVIKRANGEWTYVAADIAYIKNKIDRGFNKIVMVLGQDHHSFAIRMNGILQALGYSTDYLKIILYQLVTVKDAGELVRLSKRKGNIISLKDIIETVGSDIARFFYLNKKADAHLDFDIHAALQNTDANPAFYIQYAYVRINSVVKKANSIYSNLYLNKNENYNFDFIERTILRKCFYLDSLLENILETYQPHLISYYVYELSSLFHSYYAKSSFIVQNNEIETAKRISIIKSVYSAISKSMEIMGMTKPEKM